MTLSLATARCQGRTVRALGSATLARECTNCERRTDIPADVDLNWIQPPPVFPYLGTCSGHIAPDDPDEMQLTAFVWQL